MMTCEFCGGPGHAPTNCPILDNRVNRRASVTPGKSTHATIWIHGWEETWRKFVEICKRETGYPSASEKIRDFVTNYVKVHEPGNPQWPLNRWLEAPPRMAAPDPAQPMPDYAHMTDEQLRKLYGHPRTPASDRAIITFFMKKRGIYREPST